MIAAVGSDNTVDMPNKDRSFHESPDKAGGEGWLYSERQQKLCHLTPNNSFAP